MPRLRGSDEPVAAGGPQEEGAMEVLVAWA